MLLSFHFHGPLQGITAETLDIHFLSLLAKVGPFPYALGGHCGCSLICWVLLLVLLCLLVTGFTGIQLSRGLTDLPGFKYS